MYPLLTNPSILHPLSWPPPWLPHLCWCILAICMQCLSLWLWSWLAYVIITKHYVCADVDVFFVYQSFHPSSSMFTCHPDYLTSVDVISLHACDCEVDLRMWFCQRLLHVDVDVPFVSQSFHPLSSMFTCHLACLYWCNILAKMCLWFTKLPTQPLCYACDLPWYAKLPTSYHGYQNDKLAVHHD